jgi:hypothetical protein
MERAIVRIAYIARRSHEYGARDALDELGYHPLSRGPYRSYIRGRDNVVIDALLHVPDDDDMTQLLARSNWDSLDRACQIQITKAVYIPPGHPDHPEQRVGYIPDYPEGTAPRVGNIPADYPPSRAGVYLPYGVIAIAVGLMLAAVPFLFNEYSRLLW